VGTVPVIQRDPRIAELASEVLDAEPGLLHGVKLFTML
jgi:hypothetical protein